MSNNLSLDKSAIYIVPTPIGNLNDISYRALFVLKNVDIIIAESISKTGMLLKKFSIKNNLLSLKKNEENKINILLKKLKSNYNAALVSNAGTPLINDPGFNIVKTCKKNGIKVIPLPGPCAAITALSASGLSTSKFCYEGFLPKKQISRLNLLNSLINESRTMIFYESTHRILTSLRDISVIFGYLRYVSLAKELTKIWEIILGAPVRSLYFWIKNKKINKKGEIVIIVEGLKKDKNIISSEAIKTLSILKKEISIKKAINLTSKIHNIRRNIVYNYTINNSL